MAWYYRYETKGIQSWILDAGRLRELAGGSQLIERLTQQAVEHSGLAQDDILQSAAGGMTAKFNDFNGLRLFAAEWPMFVAQYAPGLQVIQAWVEEREGEDPLRALFVALGAKRNHPSPALPEAGPWMSRAGRSGLPAIKPPAELVMRGPRRSTFDKPSVARERAYQEDVRARGEGERARAFDWMGVRFEEDLEQWGDSHVAVVHADGSGVGRRIVSLLGGAKGAEASRTLQAFSAALSESTRAATQRALESLQVMGDLPARPIVVGGDDLTFLVTARFGLRLTREWQLAFEEETAARLKDFGGGLCSGAGVVWVHSHYPFAQALELAEQACGAAKKSAAELGGGTPKASVLQMRRVTTSLADASRPSWTWSLEGLGGLDELVCACGELPRGTLRTWLSLHDRRDTRRARLHIERAYEVAGERQRATLRDALRRCGADAETWVGREGEGQPAGATPLRDALAVMRMSARGGDR